MMFDRMVLAVIVIVAGIAAFQLLLFAQRRWVLNRSRREAGVGRAALLVFTSPTCAPCKLQQLPIIDHILADWRDKIEVEIVDIDTRILHALHIWTIELYLVQQLQLIVAVFGCCTITTLHGQIRAQFWYRKHTLRLE